MNRKKAIEICKYYGFLETLLMIVSIAVAYPATIVVIKIMQYFETDTVASILIGCGIAFGYFFVMCAGYQRLEDKMNTELDKFMFDR